MIGVNIRLFQDLSCLVIYLDKVEIKTVGARILSSCMAYLICIFGGVCAENPSLGSYCHVSLRIFTQVFFQNLLQNYLVLAPIVLGFSTLLV